MSELLSQHPLCPQLRTDAHHIHVHLNRYPLLKRVTRSSPELPPYTLTLGLCWQLCQPAVTLLRHALAEGLAELDYTDRYKTGWLTQGLVCFRLPRESGGEVPGPVELVATRNQAEVIGLLYALEGSPPGGQVIRQHLLPNLAITRNTGARFFNGYGTQTPQLWVACQQFANHALDSLQEQGMACDYARSFLNS